MMENFGWNCTCKECSEKFSAESHAGHTVTMKQLNFEAYKCPQCETINLLNFEIAPVPLTPDAIWNPNV